MAVTLNNLRKALHLDKSITDEILGVALDKVMTTRDCTTAGAFLTNSLSTSVVSSEVEQSGQVSGGSQRNKGPFH